MEPSGKLTESIVLAQLGVNDKNQWMLYDEKLKPFFEYIAANLDQDNILTPEEVFQYDSLLTSGAYKEGDELAEELKELEKCFPGIFSVTDGSIEEMQRELGFLKKNTAEREDRIVQIEQAQRKQLLAIESNRKQYIELEYQEKLLTDECLEKARTLENLQKSNQTSVLQSKHTYIQPQNPPCLLYQMPLDQLSHKLDQFISQLEVFMRKHFNITSSPEEADRDEESIKAIVDIKQRIIEIESRKFDDELTLAGFTSIIRSIDELKQKFGSEVQNIRSMIDSVEEENERLEFQFDIVRKDAQMLLEQIAEQKMAKIFNEHFKAVNTHALERLDAIKIVNDLTENITLTCELLWAVMQLDIDRLNNRVDNSEELATEAHDVMKRMRAMKVSASTNQTTSLNEFFFKKLQQVLTENLPLEQTDLPNLVACFQEYINFEDKTQRTIKSNVSQENLSEIHEFMKQTETRLEFLRGFVFNGPTNRPKLYDTKLSMQIFDREQKKIEIEKAYEEAKSNYQKKIYEPSHDRFVRMERNLWIYFLTEPKKVLECIKEVQKKAAEKGSASFKSMNITLPKQN